MIHTRLSKRATASAFSQFPHLFEMLDGHGSNAANHDKAELGQSSLLLHASTLNEMSEALWMFGAAALDEYSGENATENVAENSPKNSTKNRSDFRYRFYEQDAHPDERYYEEIIYQDKCIPTRNDSLHDFFNGLIWLHYPKTKAYLNQLHWQDIGRLGYKQRTPRRDRVTHFDECGLVLLTRNPQVSKWIQAHDWQSLFVEHHHLWSSDIIPLHFGHANLEMLCDPFIGLTAKAMVICDESLVKVSQALFSSNEALRVDKLRGIYKKVDARVLSFLRTEQVFDTKRAFLPVPLLGIPTWHWAKQDAAFYDNTEYFMPHPSKRYP